MSAPLKEMREGEKIVRRWMRANSLGGGSLVLVEGDRRGMRLLRNSPMYRPGYKPISILVGHKQNGGPIFSDRVTVEAAEQHAQANNYEEVGT